MKTSHRHILVPLAALLSHLSPFCQQLPQNMLTDWSNPGMDSAIPTYDTIDVQDFDFVADGLTSNDQAMDEILASHAASPTVFRFPAGDFLFRRPIKLTNGLVIKGASSAETRFVFDLENATNCIQFIGIQTAEVSAIPIELKKDSNTVLVADASLFQPGDFIKIYSEDTHLVTSDWAKYSTGQICQISAINGNQLTLEKPLRRGHLPEHQPKVTRLKPVQFAGVECLSLLRKDSTSEQTANILFSMAANCWVKGVRSQFCNFSHVTISQSTKLTVSGCHFQDAFNYGGGGKGYGVALQFSSGDCLIENNSFQHLRHSMLLQAGANGNVLGYNYSLLPYWTETQLPSFAAGDLVLHGNYPYANLLEGNIVQNIVIDNSHGINGPCNSFFRNRAELFGIFMNNDPASSEQLFVGNEVTSMLPYTGFFILEGTGHFSYGNNIKGSVTPANSNDLSIQSLYLETPPDFMEAANLDMAGIGFPNAINTGTIPAKMRFSVGEFTTCEPLDTAVVSSVSTSSFTTNQFQVFPNPASDVLQVEGLGAAATGSISNLTGRVFPLKMVAGTTALDVSNLPPAIYFLTLEQQGSRRQTKFVKLGE